MARISSTTRAKKAFPEIFRALETAAESVEYSQDYKTAVDRLRIDEQIWESVHHVTAELKRCGFKRKRGDNYFDLSEFFS